MSDPLARNDPNFAPSSIVHRTESSATLGAARVLVLIGGLFLVAMGLLIGSIGILTSYLDPSSRLLMLTASISFMALTMGFGSMLAWQAFQSIQCRRSRVFKPRHSWLWGLVFVLVILLGHGLLTLGPPWSMAFPPLHVLAAVLPPMVIVGLVAKSLGGISRRHDVIFQMGSGALVATFVAISLEITVLLGMAVGALAFISVLPGGLEQIQALAGRLQDPTWLEDPGQLSSLASSPLIILAVLLVFALVVPLIEESVKTIGVPLRSYRRPGLSQAFFWGLAGGAGFALAEGLFNSLGDLDAWAIIVSFRVGATLLHCLTGALMGLAWYFVLIDRQWSRGLGLYAVSVGIHGVWNTLTAIMAVASLRTQGSLGSDANAMVSDWAVATPLALLLLLALTVGASLAILTRWVHHKDAKTTSPLQGASSL